MKRIKGLLLVSAITLIIACGGPSPQGREVKTIAVATLMSHPALDQVSSGMKEELGRRGWADGKNVKYVEFNANQQMNVVPSIANDISAQRPDIAVAVTTPMAQAMVKVVKTPLVFAAVTDPVGAGVVADLEKGSGNVTGTSDAWPYKDQLRLIREILPEAKKLGVLYNPGEAASQYGIRKIREYAPGMGFELVEGSVNSTTEVRPVAESLLGRVDALFLSSDNTVIAGSVGALKAAISARKPLFVGDSGTVAKGGIAAVSVGYKELGHKTGELVDRMLRGERNLPVIVGQGTDVYINKKAAELMGVTIPEAVLHRATQVYTSIEQ